MFLRLLKQFFVDESAQAFTEYGAILAFVAAFVALAFGLQGPLAEALHNAFSVCQNQINYLAAGS